MSIANCTGAGRFLLEETDIGSFSLHPTLLLGVSGKVMGLPRDAPLACTPRPMGLFCLNMGGGRLAGGAKGPGEGPLGTLLLGNGRPSLVASLSIMARAFLSVAAGFVGVLISGRGYHFL